MSQTPRPSERRQRDAPDRRRLLLASNREFARLCGNSNVVAFAEKAITQSYCDKIPHHADELRVMMKSIFPRLVRVTTARLNSQLRWGMSRPTSSKRTKPISGSPTNTAATSAT